MLTAKKMQEYLFSIPAFSPISYFLLFITVTARNSATSTAHAVKNAYPNHNGVTHPITAITLDNMSPKYANQYIQQNIYDQSVHTYIPFFIVLLLLLHLQLHFYNTLHRFVDAFLRNRSILYRLKQSIICCLIILRH